MIKFLDLQKVTQRYSDEIQNSVARVVNSGWYLQGVENSSFEQKYSQYIGAKYQEEYVIHNMVYLKVQSFY